MSLSDRVGGFNFRVWAIDPDGTLAVTGTFWMEMSINGDQKGDMDKHDLTLSLVSTGLMKLHDEELRQMPIEDQTRLRRAEGNAQSQRLGLWINRKSA